MLRTIIYSLVIACFALAFTHPASAGSAADCLSEACRLLHRGHVRGRLPIACVSIPYIKEGYGEVALFVMRDFNPDDTPEGIQEQLTHALFRDSKITGPVDDFCRNPANFAGGNWVILCDEHHWGAITGEPLRYARTHGRPPENRRVRIGTRT